LDEEARKKAAREPEQAPKTEAEPPKPAPVVRGISEPWDVVPVFYGTDRGRQQLGASTVYGTERARRLELGRALVTVPKAHQIPNIERPWIYRLPFTQIVLHSEPEDPRQHFTLKDVRPLSKEEFLELVQERLKASSDYKDHALVFVHGFNTSFEYALYRTAQIAYDIKFDGVPLLYSWPSMGSLSLQDYSHDRESSGQAEPYLREFLELVARDTGAKSVSIIAHSMGNQLLLPALRDLKRMAPADVTISQVILAAPDVDRDAFENIAHELMGVSRGVTMLAASNDLALDISRRFWGGVPRAGDVPPGGPIVTEGIDTIDITAVSTKVFALNHSGYADTSALLSDLQLLIQTGERPPDKRVPILERIKTAKGDYWRYPR
jgi:esterase/lipase superfamily enzyme